MTEKVKKFSCCCFNCDKTFTVEVMGRVKNNTFCTCPHCGEEQVRYLKWDTPIN